MAKIQNRGGLTDRVLTRGRELLGRDITQVELRLMPYIQYVSMNMNSPLIDPSKLTDEEHGIVQQWREAGLLTGSGFEVGMTKHFWDALSEILYLAYVNLGEYD